MSENPEFIEVQKFLKGVDYPVNRDELVRMAEDAGANGALLDALRNLPPRQYNGPTEVSEAIAT